MQHKTYAYVIFALMLGAHPAHYLTHQGVPDPNGGPVIACPDVPGLRAPDLPARFDSEREDMRVQVRLRTDSMAVTGGGLDATVRPATVRATTTIPTPTIVTD